MKKNLAYRRIAGEVFVVDAPRSEMHELNGPAALIWEGLAAGKTKKDLVKAMTAEFEVDGETALADLEIFIKDLLESGLLSAKSD
ncbi:MAG: hypothetical protein AUJ51_10720 [Elusimicrobia bacterium CG1_02_56_21]|nr:MAG: hypothetical protein AUJ51_10720 [Elusimicrobia bacterium CG1_02_56_21]